MTLRKRERRIEVTGRRGRRRKQLLDDLKEKRRKDRSDGKTREKT
jgi:hypothetical protein